MTVQRTELKDTVDRFVHGAKTMLVGRFLDVEPLFEKGLNIVKDATRMLDLTSESGRDPLLPLLDHQDEMVRTVAGAALWQAHTDRARKTIEDVDNYGITEASMLAWKILFFHGRYNPIPSDPGYDGLYDGDHDPKRFHDPAFSARALRGELPGTFARRTRRGGGVP
jgi:hypothetical protein